jgi:hypothetical protein
MLDTGHGDPALGQVGSAVFLAKAAVDVHMVRLRLHLAGAKIIDDPLVSRLNKCPRCQF